MTLTEMEPTRRIAETKLSRILGLSRLETIWSEKEDAAPTPLQRQLLFLSTAMMASFAVFWGAIYFVFDERTAAFIPWSYMVLSFLNLSILKKPSHYRILRTSQLLFSLLLPFFLMWELGGLVNSSAVILWSFTCPMGALVFAGRRQAAYWFIAFALLVLISALVNYPAVEPTNRLPVAVIVTFFVLNLTAVSFFSFALIRFFVLQSGKAYDLLEIEREKTESLVRNMLPTSIAHRLKEQARPIADRIEEVTILFADIVGFTPFSMERPPEEVVSLLDDIFSSFDEIASELELEKIKTIGDAYMICGGLTGDGDNTLRAAKFAFGALSTIERIDKTRHQGLRLRIGIHRGPVVAGVIGKAKFSYDVWGDAVNVAARLQQNSDPGEILISDAVKRQLGDLYDYTPRGQTELKGHDAIEAFFLKEKS